jgi:hypothetical protein
VAGQHRVARQADHVVHPDRLQPIQQRGTAQAAVEADQEACPGERPAQPRDRADQHAAEALSGRGAQPQQISGTDRVLKARERGLRGQAVAGDRIAIEQQLVDRIVREARRVVGIGVAAGQAEDALPHQVLHRVHDLARLARIGQTGGHPSRQAQPLIDGLQQDRAPIRTAVCLVEPGDHRPLAEEWEQDRLCGRIRTHRHASEVGICYPQQHLYHSGGVVVSTFMNYPG